MKICGWLVFVTKLFFFKSKNDPAISLRIKNTNLPNPNFFHENSELDDIHFKNWYIITVSATYRGVTELPSLKWQYVTK